MRLQHIQLSSFYSDSFMRDNQFDCIIDDVDNGERRKKTHI